MPLPINQDLRVNGLSCQITGNAGTPPDREGYVPSTRQLLLIEEAINECTFDWWRFGALQAETTTVDIRLVSEAWLYAGHLGLQTRGETGVTVVRPDGASSSGAWAPAMRPNGMYGDYGVVSVSTMTGIFSKSDKIYILQDLDERNGALGGARFFKETLIRLLGQLIAMKWAMQDPYKMYRAATCFTPVDRRDFEADNYITRAQQWWGHSVGQYVPGPSHFIYRPGGNPLFDLPIGQEEGEFTDATPPYEQIASTPKGWGTAVELGQSRWPWENRLIEAIGEAFKDTFLPRRSRRFNNRTAVKLKASAEAFDRFVTLYLDEVPILGGFSGDWTSSNDVDYLDVLEVINPDTGATEVIGQSWRFEETQHSIARPNDPAEKPNYFPPCEIQIRVIDRPNLFHPTATPFGGTPRRNASSTWSVDVLGLSGSLRSAPDLGMLFQQGQAREVGYGETGLPGSGLFNHFYFPGSSTLTDPKFRDPRNPDDVQVPVGGWKSSYHWTGYNVEYVLPKSGGGVSGLFHVHFLFQGACTKYDPACSLAEGLDNDPSPNLAFLPVTIGYWDTHFDYRIISRTKGHPVNPFLPVATAQASRPGSRRLTRPVTGKAGPSRRIDTDFLRDPFSPA